MTFPAQKDSLTTSTSPFTSSMPSEIGGAHAPTSRYRGLYFVVALCMAIAHLSSSQRKRRWEGQLEGGVGRLRLRWRLEVEVDEPP